MNEELKGIIERLKADGASQEQINEVVELYKAQNEPQVEAEKDSSAKDENTDDRVDDALSYTKYLPGVVGTVSKVYSLIGDTYDAYVTSKEQEKKKADDEFASKMQDENFSTQANNLRQQVVGGLNEDPTIFGKAVEESGSWEEREEKIREAIKEDIGGQTWLRYISNLHYQGTTLDPRTEIGEQDYGLLSKNDIDRIVDEEVSNQWDLYNKTKKQNNIARKSDTIEDYDQWATESDQTTIDSYIGVDKDIARARLNLRNKDLSTAERQVALDTYNELVNKKTEFGGGSVQIIDVSTGDLISVRSKSAAENAINNSANYQTLDTQSRIDEIKKRYELADPETTEDMLETELRMAQLALGGHKDILNQSVSVTVIDPKKVDSPVIDPEVTTSVKISNIINDENYTSTLGIIGQAIKGDITYNVESIQKLTTHDGKELTERSDIKNYIDELTTDSKSLALDVDALSNMYYLNQGLDAVDMPDYVEGKNPLTFIPTDVEGLKASAKAIITPWESTYYADNLVGYTGRDKAGAYERAYNSLGVEMTPEEQEMNEVSLGETVNEGLLGSNRVIVEFAALNKATAAVGITARWNSLMNALTRGKYVTRGGKIFTRAAVESKAAARGLSLEKYIGQYGGFLTRNNTIIDKGVLALGDGIMEGGKFWLIDEFEGSESPYSFWTGFGFGGMNRVLRPLNPFNITKKIKGRPVKTDIDFRVTKSGKRFGVNAEKLYDKMITSPASFTVGSEMGEIMSNLVEDAMGMGSFRNFIDEHYGHQDEVGKRLISQYFIGFGMGLTHGGFGDLKSRAALERTKNKEVDSLREWARKNNDLLDLTEAEINDITSPKVIEKINDAVGENSVFGETLTELGKEAGILGKNQNLIDDYIKKIEVINSLNSRIFRAYRAQGYLDPAIAEKLVRQDHKKLIEEEAAAGNDVKIEVVNNDNLNKGQKPIDPSKNAEIILGGNGKPTVIRYNAYRYTPGVMPHEVHHYYLDNLFGRDAVFKAEFMENLGNIAKSITLNRLVSEAEAKKLNNEQRAGEKMTLEEATRLEYGDYVFSSRGRGSKTAQWEIFAHLAEALGNKNNYMDVLDSQGFSQLKEFLMPLSKRTGRKLDLTTQADVVRWLAQYGENIKKGKSNVELFEELRQVIDVEGTRQQKEWNDMFRNDPLELSSKILDELKAEKVRLIEENKKLSEEKPDGWMERAKANAELIKGTENKPGINDRIKDLEGVKKQGDPKEAINKHLSVTEGTTSTGKPRYRSEFTEADVESGRITQEEYDSWLDNAKSRTSEAIFRSNFTKNAIKQGMEELGIPKGGTAEAEFVDNVMFKLQEKFLKEYDPSKQDDPFGWLFFTGGGRGVGALYRAKGDVMNEYKKQVKTEQIDAIKDFENMYGEGAAGEATTSGPAEIAKERVMFTETVDFAESELQRIEDAVRDANVDVDNLTYKDTKKLLNQQKLLPNGKIPTSSKNVVGEGPLLDVLTVVSEKFGIPVERVLANQDLSGKLRNSARDFISENARQLINSLPEGTTPSGKSTGIANTKLGEFYVKGERVKMAETGSKQGLEEQTRQDITKRDFLEMFGINADGTYTKGTKFDSAIRELIVQTASIISNQKARQVKNSMQAKIGEGRNEAMASKQLDIEIGEILLEKNIDREFYDSLGLESYANLKPAYAKFAELTGIKINDIPIKGDYAYDGVTKETKAKWIKYTSNKLRKTFPDGKISENMIEVMYHDLLHSGNKGSRNMVFDSFKKGKKYDSSIKSKLEALNDVFDVDLKKDNTSTVGEGVYIPNVTRAKGRLVRAYKRFKKQGLTGNDFNEKFLEKLVEEFSPDGTVEGLEKAIEANRKFLIEDIMRDAEAMLESQDGLDMAMFDYKLRGINQFGLWRLAGASLKTVNPEAFADYKQSELEHSIRSVENRVRVIQAIAKYGKSPQTLRKVLNALLLSGRVDFIEKADVKQINHSQGTKGIYVDSSVDVFMKDSMLDKQIRVLGKYRGLTERDARMQEIMESSEALEAAAKKAKSVPENQRSAEALIVLEAVKAIKEFKRLEKAKAADITVKQPDVMDSRELDIELNNILEHSIGVESAKEISRSEAGIKGAKSTKGLMGLIGGSRRRLFLPDSAADLDLLLEPLYGKGAIGIKNKKWFQDNFYRKFEEGINKYNTARQKSITSYQKLRKDMPSVVKQLGKDVPGKSFTTDMALRVHIWEKAGFEVPDLPEATKADMLEHVRSNPELLAYAYRLSKLTGIKTGLKKPTGEWWAESIASEISDVARGVERSEFMADFIDARKVIFSEKNLNKMESRLGKEWRNSIEDMFDRMETGRLRSEGMSPITSKLINYFNGSIGTIMNFNTRSAVLQLISSVNFINMSFNNPLRAAQAFANQKQYWKDFMTIMNSDMLKQRRNGLQINVTEAELAEAAGKSKNPAQAVLAKLIKAGYLPTKIADSVAIASGGATYYRNAVRKYMKEGMSKAEAEQKAFLDFQAIAERTQQSSRPDLISKQQTTLAGRLILPFANTPLQMNRIMMKEILDLKKGRFKGAAGFTEKMGKVGYYGFLQTTIFAALQSAAMAVFTNSDDDELKAKKQTQMLETVTDSFLRGMGIKGAVLNGVINAVKEFKAQDEKGFSADFSEVAEDLLSISPPVGSKFRQLDAAGNAYKYNKKQIMQEGFDVDIDSPGLEAVTRTSEALFNVPVNRVQKKLTNLRNAMDADYETWQRVLMALGWSEWDVAPEEAKEKRDKKKQEAVDAADAVVEKENMKLQDEEKKQGKEVTCASVSRSGNRCKRKVLPGKRFCTVHEKVESREDGKETQCTHIKSNGDRCKMQTTNKSGKCYYHD